MIGELVANLKKSQTTGFALPTINKHFGNRYKEYQTERSRRSTSMKSQFLEKVKGQITKDEQYEYLQTSMISEQQKKLKNILREFNHETYAILNKFIDHPKPVKQFTPKERSLSDVAQLRDKEIQNKNKIIEQCQTQINKMEERCQNLKYMTHQQMQKQISNTKKQIQALKVSNKQFIREVTLNGLSICKGERFNQIKQIQYQRLIAENKRTHLKEMEEEMNKESQILKAKNEKADKQYEKLQNQYKELPVSAESNGQRSKQDMKEKKRSLEVTKHRNQLANNASKHKYLQKLKEIEECTANSKKHQLNISKAEEGLQKTRKQLLLFEQKLLALKVNKNTIKLLESPPQSK